MTIDWVTVSAQIINFLILVWLLKHFLYQPVIRAMDQRQQLVNQRLKDAEQREEEATQLGDRYAQQQRKLEFNHDQILQQAHDQGAKIKNELLAQARDEVATARATWQQQLEHEKQQFLESLQKKVMQNVLKIARKALTDLATTNLEAQVVAKFVENLKAMEAIEIEQLAQTSRPISVRSSFPLDERSRQQITQAIRAALQTERKPEFLTKSDQALDSIKGWGIELDIAEQRLGWNLARYLDDLEAQFDKALAGSTSKELC